MPVSPELLSQLDIGALSFLCIRHILNEQADNGSMAVAEDIRGHVGECLVLGAEALTRGYAGVRRDEDSVYSIYQVVYVTDERLGCQAALVGRKGVSSGEESRVSRATLDHRKP